jgi:SAM-dependent methyltransferase
MHACRLCRLSGVEPLLDLGAQALCNRFLASPTDDEAAFPFVLGQCRGCGVVQLASPVAPRELRSRYEWITYREPEAHLDDLVDTLCSLPGLAPTSIVGAVSSKDDSTLERFRKRGFSNTWRIDVERDLNVVDREAGLETIQLHLDPDRADAIAGQHGAADLLIARHIVEHAHDPARFVAALRRLVRPNGYIVLEVPDCGPALQRGDYTMPWEEHVLYFTSDLLRQAVTCWGLSAVTYKLYPYSHENSLVAILRSPILTDPAAPDPGMAEVARAMGQTYARSFPAYRRRVEEALAAVRARRGRVAVFGAGHLSCAWINFLGVGSHVEFVVDDAPQKRGLFMPGSRLPILGSSQLIPRGITLCLLTLSQESEARVLANNRTFLDRGGAFASIFPGRPNALLG